MKLNTNKSARFQLYVIAQCIVMLNCFLCFLKIYETHLISVSYGLIGIAIVLFMISGVFRNFRFSVIPVSFMVLFAYLLLGDIINSNLGTFTSSMCLSGLALFFFFSFFSGSDGNMEKVLNAVFLVSLILATAVSILSFFNPGINDEGILTNRNALASYSSLGIVSSVYLADRKRILSLRNGVILLMLSMNAITLIRTESRTPLMVLITFFIIFSFYIVREIISFRFNKKVIMYMLFIIICLIVIAAGIVFIVERNEFSRDLLSVRDIINRISTSRLDIWAVCLKLTAESPLFGLNDGHYDEVMMSSLGVIHSPHNVYFSLMAINGIPALLIYLFIIGYSLVSGIRTIGKMSSVEEKQRVYFCLAVLCGYLVGDFFECFSIRSYMPSAYIVILMFAALEAERLRYAEKV